MVTSACLCRRDFEPVLSDVRGCFGDGLDGAAEAAAQAFDPRAILVDDDRAARLDPAARAGAGAIAVLAVTAAASAKAEAIADKRYDGCAVALDRIGQHVFGVQKLFKLFDSPFKEAFNIFHSKCPFLLHAQHRWTVGEVD